MVPVPEAQHGLDHGALEVRVVLVVPPSGAHLEAGDVRGLGARGLPLHPLALVHVGQLHLTARAALRDLRLRLFSWGPIVTFASSSSCSFE